MSLESVYQRNLHHRGSKSGWLRAAVLGANDGLVSNASLLIGVAASGRISFLPVAGLAGIAAGSISMAVGEYISVQSQADIEASDRKMEIEHLQLDPEGELEELTQIYEERGLSRELAEKVAQALSEKDVLAAHLRDELGHFEANKAEPGKAALASAVSFALGATIPLIGALIGETPLKVILIIIFTLLGLVSTGAISSKLAGSPLTRTVLRVLIGGGVGMAITAGIGALIRL
ncbi:MAG: VIT family protein [Actinomycetota bacterium]